MVATGAAYEEIAKRVELSPATVRTDVQNANAMPGVLRNEPRR